MTTVGVRGVSHWGGALGLLMRQFLPSGGKPPSIREAEWWLEEATLLTGPAYADLVAAIVQ